MKERFGETMQEELFHGANEAPVGEVNDKMQQMRGDEVKIPSWTKEMEDAEKRTSRDMSEEGGDIHLDESLKGLNWNLLDAGKVGLATDIKDMGLILLSDMFITVPGGNHVHRMSITQALQQYQKWKTLRFEGENVADYDILRLLISFLEDDDVKAKEVIEKLFHVYRQPTTKADSEEIDSRMRISEQTDRGSLQTGWLQWEIQRIQFFLMKLDGDQREDDISKVDDLTVGNLEELLAEKFTIVSSFVGHASYVRTLCFADKLEPRCSILKSNQAVSFVGARLVSLAICAGGMWKFVIMFGLISEAILMKVDCLRQGKSAVLESKHILILEWSDNLGSVFKLLAIAYQSMGGTIVVVLAERDKTEMECLDKNGVMREVRKHCIPELLNNLDDIRDGFVAVSEREEENSSTLHDREELALSRAHLLETEEKVSSKEALIDELTHELEQKKSSESRLKEKLSILQDLDVQTKDLQAKLSEQEGINSKLEEGLNEMELLESLSKDQADKRRNAHEGDASIVQPHGSPTGYMLGLRNQLVVFMCPKQWKKNHLKDWMFKYKQKAFVLMQVETLENCNAKILKA